MKTPIEVTAHGGEENQEIARVLQEFVDYMWEREGPEIMRQLAVYGKVDWEALATKMMGE